MKVDDWIPVAEKVPGADHRFGGRRSFSDYLLVTVACQNGLRFVDVDRFDGDLRTWETFHGDGREVIAWTPLPSPAQ